ncbi:hypothetical protein NDU88_005388 [Pleurodeles waltl]|uniref:Uncharacterized protein n=1 Tax=Pleurodeles waltl TaxID=8319 RepID=A0AAV7W7N8_PLEWA|nr:hypothetical protein NDU88_005388 [Pleurodeles waltl]
MKASAHCGGMPTSRGAPECPDGVVAALGPKVTDELKCTTVITATENTKATSETSHEQTNKWRGQTNAIVVQHLQRRTTEEENLSDSVKKTLCACTDKANDT